jgi:hypothetical protein
MQIIGESSSIPNGSSLIFADEHLKNFTGPCTPGYHALPEKIYRQIESRILRSAEFVGVVLIPFIMEDFRQYMVSTSFVVGFVADGRHS